MSRRLWATTIILILFIAGIVTLSFIAFTQNITALSVVVLFFAALTVVAFNYLVLNPALLESAKREARNLCEAGQIVDPNLQKKLCDRLAKAPGDTEAAALHDRLKGLKKD
jgi:hypothetical protein